jgi:uncharacterized protein (TIRG00374 family)
LPRWRAVAGWLWVVVPLAAGGIAYAHRQSIIEAVGLIGRAHLQWLGPAALAIGGVYLCRAGVYAVPLKLLGFGAPVSFLWATAVAATSLHQLVPAAGATGYAFLTYAFRRRGVPGGKASLIALVDTLSYSASLATLVVVSLVYLAIGGSLEVGRVAIVFAPGAALVAVAAALYRLQRDRRRFVPLVLRSKDRVAVLFRRRWSDEPIRKFFEEYYEGKRLIGRRRGAFGRMLALQFLAIGGDVAALYMAFVAIGVRPHPWTVLMAFVVAMSGAAVIGAPGGGGSFETIMSAFFATHGLRAEQGIAGAVLYRIVAFWLPVAITQVVLFRLRRRRKAIRPE